MKKLYIKLNAIVALAATGDPTVTAPTASGRTKFRNIQDVGIEVQYVIANYIIPLIISLSLVVFLWGIFKFIKDGSNDKSREEGRQFMFWGIIGLAVMVSVWGLVRILTNTIGVPLELPSLAPLRK